MPDHRDHYSRRFELPGEGQSWLFGDSFADFPEQHGSPDPSLPVLNPVKVLDQIEQSTAGTAGQKFFAAFTQSLARSLPADFVFVVEFSPAHAEADPSFASVSEASSARTLGGYGPSGALPSVAFDTSAAPEAMTAGRGLRFYKVDGAESFPVNDLMARWQVTECAALPLVGTLGKRLGLILLLFRKPVSRGLNLESVLRVACSRAAAELERWRWERAWHDCREENRRLQQAHEKERQSLARDLHDELGQVFTALKFSLAALERTAADQMPSRLRDLQTRVNESVDRVRQWACDLRPSVLDDLGLLAAAQWQARYCEQQLGLNVELFHQGMDGRRFDPELETGLYRVLQEALTNVSRHAGVDRATVRLWATRRYLNLLVMDEGRGFHVAKALANGTGSSRGLAGMRARTEALGGEWVLKSAPDVGTSLAAYWPIAEGMEP